MYHMTALQLLDISLMPREFPHDCPIEHCVKSKTPDYATNC